MYQPEESRAEQLTDQALLVGRMPSDQIRNMRPIAAPQVLFPDTAGAKSTWTIEGVLTLDRSVQLSRSWRTGMPTVATTLIDDGFSGSTRNSLEVM